MNQNEIENELIEFGQAWSHDDSFAKSVISRIEETKAVETARKIEVASPLERGWWGRSYVAATLAILVGFAVVFGAWSGRHEESFVSAEMLTTAFRTAIESVDTVKMTTTSYDDSGKKLGGEGDGILCLFDRKLGVVRGVMDDGVWNIVDLDNGEYSWDCDFEKELVSRRGSTKAFANFFDQSVLSESDYERLQDEDMEVDGRSLACYAVRNLAPFSDGKQRVFVYVDGNNLVHFSRTWKFKNERWNLIEEVNCQYNVEIDASKLEPKFDSKFRIVDIDAEIEQLASLDGCLFSRDVDGLTYAVHRATPLKGGGLAVLASLRETERGAPLQYSIWRLRDSSSQLGRFFRIVNAEAIDGVRLQWFLLAPRDPKWHGYSSEFGIVEKNDNDAIVSGKQVVFEDAISLNGPEPDREYRSKKIIVDFEFDKIQEPVSIEEATAMIYEEQQQIAHVPYRILQLGVKKINGVPTLQSSSVAKTSTADFQAAVVNHLEYLRGKDTESERNVMERQITSGFVTIRRPAMHVSGVKQFGDKQLQRACGLRDLEVIDVSGTSVSDNGIGSLLRLKNLELLNLDETAITDGCIENLIQLKSLQKLQVRDTKISLKGLERLKAELAGVEVEY